MRRFVATTAVAAAVLFTGGVAVAAPLGPATCGVEELDVGFGRVEGAAGTVYREVVFTNRTGFACELRGFPGVSYRDRSGRQVGASAVRVGERGPTVTLAPHGGTATSDVGFASVENFDPLECLKTPAAGIRVYAPDETEPLFLPLDDAYGCAGDVSASGAHLTVASVRG